jgi:thiol-disulfide isomerase/thioredoxin
MISEGKIIKIDDIPPELLASPDIEAYADYQRALGKVYYMDKWMTPEESELAYEKALGARQRELERINRGRQQTANRAKIIASKRGGFREIRQDGAAINEQDLTIPGQYTVVEFFADWCAPCRAIDPYLKDLAEDSRVAVRKVDIVNWESPVAKQWGLRSIPHLRVYDPSGRLLGEPTSNLNQIIAYINADMQR